MNRNTRQKDSDVTRNPDCLTCQHETINGPLDSNISHKNAAAIVGCSEASIRRHRKHSMSVAAQAIAHDQEYVNDTHDPEKGSSYTRAAGTMWGENEWRDFLRLKGTDPDTVTFTFGATTNPQGGYWNKLLNVRKKPLTPELMHAALDIEAACKRVRSWNIKPSRPKASGTPVAAILNLSDMQLFKSEGGGVDATLDRLRDGLENFITEVHRQRLTHNVNEIVIVNNGDPFEGIAGNYASQTHTVQGGLRAQMNLVLDVWMNFAKILYPMFEKGQFVSVLCNHTEFGRQGGAAKSITSDSDNGSAFLAETLERVLRMSPAFDHVDFTIPHDEMNVYTEAAGVTMAFNHGHKIPGNDVTGFEKWLNGQVRGDRDAANARIWVTAHRHNFQAWDLGSTFAFSTPSCDGGSKWLRDATGRFSRSGILSFLVGNHHHLGWSDVAFL